MNITNKFVLFDLKEIYLSVWYLFKQNRFEVVQIKKVLLVSLPRSTVKVNGKSEGP